MINYWEILLGQTSAIATVATAIVALKLYSKSKNDELENAARIIILEIRESEKIIKGLFEIKNAGREYTDDLVRIVPFSSWNKYSHLFIQRLSNDEFDQLNDYFKKCTVLEKYLEKNHNFFWVTTEERAKQKEILGAQLVIRSPELTVDEFREELEKTAGLYFLGTSAYSPVGIKTQIDRNLNSMLLVTPTPLWNKLKEIARYNDLMG